MSISPFPSQQSMGIPQAEVIRVQGTVQGVGFRPMVYRLAKQFGLKGEVCNDGEGVHITVVGSSQALDGFVSGLQAECPPLAQIEAITRQPYQGELSFSDFVIVPSQQSPISTLIPPDTATCPDCLRDIFDPFSRFYRYPFTNCTHCGPRLSILQAIPYDRARTSMAAFPLCLDCQRDYEDVENRRFHAQPVACHRCGPRAWLERMDGAPITAHSFSLLDEVDAVCTLLQRGEIVAIKGLGGFHLACDATNEVAVRQLRQRKHRYHKPLALMARDLRVIEHYCRISPEERGLLESPAAPIVLLESKQSQLPGFWLEEQFLSFHRGGFADQIPPAWDLGEPGSGRPAGSNGGAEMKGLPPTEDTAPRGYPTAGALRQQQFRPLAPSVAPGQRTLGFMLPYTPLHHLMLKRMDRPIVMTSGNLSDEPQCISNEEARERLGQIADFILLHNRDIVNRVDDSVVRVTEGQMQILRRGRGYAPSPIRLPEGFQQGPTLLAMGSEVKNTFCLIREGQAILSQHMGDLEEGKTYRSYEQALALFGQIFQHRPEIVVVDQHPEYLSTKLGLSLNGSTQEGHPLRIQAVQHHHAHVAACMAENGLVLKTLPVLGIALDGLGFGDDGTLWGGEFLLADYQGYWRLASFKPVAMLGGEQAVRQPWRNTYAHLKTAFDWAELVATCGDLELIEFLSDKPQLTLDQILEKETYSPLASSAGRLFDAVAAAIGLCREEAHYEGQGAVELEALIEPEHLHRVNPYPFEITVRPEDGLWLLEPRSMWLALLADLMQGVSAPIIAARFHVGLASAIASLTHTLQLQHPFTQVVLTGGVFQNKVLTLEVKRRLVALGLTVLTHSKVPPNDGGLSLGQAVIATARHLSHSA